MQIVSIGDNLHEMSNPVSRGKKRKKNISVCRLLKILPRVLSVNYSQKTGYDILCKLSPFIGDNLHEMSNNVLWEKIRKYFSM